MKLSIIIPVYNVEKYIKRCIESVINQTNIDKDTYEIIVVDDGSPDNSMEIVKEIAKYHDIIILEQKNLGLSEARNNGLKIAKGDYIWFIDSDDWVSKNSLHSIYQAIEKEPDVIEIEYKKVFEKDPISHLKEREEENISWDANKYGKILQHHYKEISIPAQFMIYNRKFLFKNNLFFFKGIYHEDCEFKPRVIFFCRSLIRIQKVLYFYLIRESGAITSRGSLKHGLDMYQVIDNLNNFSKENNINLSMYICMFFNSILRYYKILNKKDSFILKRKFLERPFIVKNMHKSKNIKYQIEGMVLKLFPDLFFKVMRFSNKETF